MAALGVLLMARHAPLQARAATALPHMLDASDGTNSGELHAIHVLGAECGCSLRVLESLLSHPSHPNIRETIFWVSATGTDHGAQARAAALGYGFEVMQPHEATARTGLRAGPFLLLMDGSSVALYGGGYSERPRGPLYRDREILQLAMAGKKSAALPVFGCAFDDAFRRAVNPLNL
jgi:hypothetical protein